MNVTNGHTEVNGIALYHEIHHHNIHANTIVLIHGFLSSTFSFRKLTPLLQEQFNIISIDFPPFGKSGKKAAFTYSYENIASTINQFLHQLPYSHFHLVGHSMGGQICLHMVRLEQSLFRKVILLCSSGYSNGLKRSLINLTYLPFFKFFVKYHFNKTGVLGNLHLVVHNKEIIDQEMVAGYEEPFGDQAIFAALTRMFRHLNQDMQPALLHTISIPCLLIWGEHDRVVPVQIGKRLEQDLPDAKLIVLPGTGHLVPEERPFEVYAAMLAFILEE